MRTDDRRDLGPEFAWCQGRRPITDPFGQFGGSSWKDVWAFALLIIVLVFRPQGLLGAKVVDRA